MSRLIENCGLINAVTSLSYLLGFLFCVTAKLTLIPLNFFFLLYMQEESSYAVLESPCKSTGGPYNMNLYFELELQPNEYNSVVSNPLSLPSVPMQLKDASNNAPTPSSGTNI